jgi:hypothetical protein
VVRAAANAGPAAGLVTLQRGFQKQRGITVNSILQQSRQDKADAAYYRSAAEDALFAGKVGAAAGVFKGLASIGSFGTGSSGDGTGFSLERTGGLY